ncbi:hypothetical protein F511_25490 [Dorcoceras hygrometricum]|uniref:Uncharacterized protein n=1 Tax=Dorcoceras hygrometricum TaxID=472368 RepID=A0A2Z7D7S8_9LAMI|nr:hypothetical protein F511_25490 [Dorcoceras hygrometricum]
MYCPKSISLSQIIATQKKDSRRLGDSQSDVLSKINKLEKGLLDTLNQQEQAHQNFRAQAQENYNNLSTQLGFPVDYINRGGDAKKGEGGSSRPQPPPDDQSRPSGGNSARRGSGGDMRRGDRSGSSKKQRSSGGGGSGSGGVTYGPYLPPKRDAKYWILGERQF